MNLGRIAAAGRLLGRRGWAGALIAVLAFSLGCLALGQWQYGRHVAKVIRNQRIDTNYAGAPAALAAVLPTTGSALSPARLWRPVILDGRYLNTDTVVVRNRPFQGDFGYEVLVPLQFGDGSVMFVDRGWIPNGDTGVAPNTIPAAPSGPVELVVRLRLSEPNLHREPILGQAASIDLSELSARFQVNAYQAYGVLAQESPPGATPPALLGKPDEDLGPHLAYAVQWWAFALAGPLLLARALDREARELRSDSPAVAASIRRRPSDEEYEDALTGG